MPERISTPWTPEIVAALNAAQIAGRVHPFTCGRSSSHGPVLATEGGWVCTEPGCDYWQTWALVAMTERWARTPLIDDPPASHRGGEDGDKTANPALAALREAQP